MVRKPVWSELWDVGNLGFIEYSSDAVTSHQQPPLGRLKRCSAGPETPQQQPEHGRSRDVHTTDALHTPVHKHYKAFLQLKQGQLQVVAVETFTNTCTFLAFEDSRSLWLSALTENRTWNISVAHHHPLTDSCWQSRKSLVVSELTSAAGSLEAHLGRAEEWAQLLLWLTPSLLQENIWTSCRC